ncbi:MAG: hypothetical protein VYA34_02515 [Myxococcota bacterium]|nr:hypothetical protein [Myxococcota bacterium]
MEFKQYIPILCCCFAGSHCSSNPESVEITGNQTPSQRSETTGPLTCDGRPTDRWTEVLGTPISCSFPNQTQGIDVHGLEVSQSALTLPALNADDNAIYVFAPRAWPLGDLSNTPILTLKALKDFVFQAGTKSITPPTNGSDETNPIREKSDGFATEIVNTTHACLDRYLRDFEIMSECIGNEKTDCAPR